MPLNFCILVHVDIGPTYLSWTIMDIWLTTYVPQLVYAVFEWPLRAHCPNSYCEIE